MMKAPPQLSLMNNLNDSILINSSMAFQIRDSINLPMLIDSKINMDITLMNEFKNKYN